MWNEDGGEGPRRRAARAQIPFPHVEEFERSVFSSVFACLVLVLRFRSRLRLKSLLKQLNDWYYNSSVPSVMLFPAMPTEQLVAVSSELADGLASALVFGHLGHRHGCGWVRLGLQVLGDGV